MAAAVGKLFADAGVADGDSVMRLVHVLGGKLSANTWRSYNSIFAQFVKFCVSQDLQCLPASQATALRWAMQLASQGTVRASTSGPYFAAVNTFHELVGFEKPCVGTVLSAFRKAWVRMQLPLALDSDAIERRAPVCPASVALQWYQALDGLPASSELFRPLLFSCLAFRTFLRPATLLSARDAVLECSRDSRVLRFTATSWKTQLHSQAVMPVVSVDVTAQPVLQAALQMWLATKPTSTALLWHGGFSTQQAAAWFVTSVTTVAPQMLGSLSLYSCRRGGASAAAAIGVSLDVIEAAGGWALNSSALRQCYLDRSVAADAAARF